MVTHNPFSLKLVKNNPKDLLDYVRLMIEWVDEIDKRPIRDEINKIQSQYHIDNFFIMRDGNAVGVVKITHSTFYSMGLTKEVSKEEYDLVFDLIEDDLKGWRIDRYEATLHANFVPYALSRGYEIEFSRKKLKLDLETVKNMSDYDGLISRTYQRGDLSNLIDTFIDAYRESVDEKIGMFGGGIASSAISSILRGNFGVFIPEMSPLILANDSDYIEAASLTTISEGCPFVVIIGVRRAEQSKGYGRKLLSWVIDRAKREGYDEIRLWVTEENTKASHLYDSMGFREISRISSLVKKLF
jgi:GNAT superfamily N-acetyltransferase